METGSAGPHREEEEEVDLDKEEILSLDDSQFKAAVVQLILSKDTEEGSRTSEQEIQSESSESSGLVRQRARKLPWLFMLSQLTQFYSPTRNISSTPSLCCTKCITAYGQRPVRTRELRETQTSLRWISSRSTRNRSLLACSRFQK